MQIRRQICTRRAQKVLQMGRRNNRRGRIEGNCGLLPILLNFFSVRFRERKQDEKEYLSFKKQCKACFDRNFSK